MKRRLVLGLLLVVLLLLRADTFALTPARATASAHLFSLIQWEVTNLPSKWLHLLWNTLPGRKPPREKRLELLQEYLALARKVQKEEDRLEGVYFRRSTTLVGGATKEKAPASDEYLNELLEAKEKLRAEAEEAIEAELSAVLIDEGFGFRLGLLFPPVDLRFEEPPTILVISPRDRLLYQEGVILSPDMPVLERDRLEKEILQRHDLSALVDNLAGLGTYPSIVSDLYPLRTVLQTAAHEWLHHYLFFRPMGRNFRSSAAMFTLNETAADLAGRELGDTTFVRVGGDLSVSSSRYLSPSCRTKMQTKHVAETDSDPIRRVLVSMANSESK